MYSYDALKLVKKNVSTALEHAFMSGRLNKPEKKF